MNIRKVITVRYLTGNENRPLSRPHKIQKITDQKGTVRYSTMNNSREIDPVTFTLQWKKQSYEPKIVRKQESTWEIIRVKFVLMSDKYSRPKRVYKITTGDVVTYAPIGVKGTARRINPILFITEWEHGPTPTPQPPRKLCDVSLKKLGYSIEQIKEIRGRNFSAKDVKIVRNKLKISTTEARDLLIKHNGSRHLIYKSLT
jgi:hypothetical protein